MMKDKRRREQANESESYEIPVGSAEEEPEPDAPEEEVNSPAEDTVAEPSVEDRCAQLEAKVEELEDQRLRAIAELDNYRKRMARQFDELVRSSNDRLLAEFLEIVDNFERALEHARNGKSEGDANNEALLEGTELIYSQMKSLLERYGVTPIDSVGKPFDPNLHEALMQVESDEYDDGIVAQEVTRGYMIGDRVLRHARVAVSKGKE
jgi:molecular chaperone GrpE